MAQRKKEIEKSVTPSLSETLAACPVWITYVPLRGEAAFAAFLSPPKGAAVYEIAPRASLDPLAEAQKAMTLANGRAACVLMPGRSFDRYGTRLGQGGGWYDRFLATVPAHWIRVGFCSAERLSTERLTREPWDQPMDYVCVVRDSTVAPIRTNARSATIHP